jgi:outer membrane protein assembly factor BamB
MLWHYTAGVPFRTGPTVDGARVFAVTNDNVLYALSAKTGAVLWSYVGVPEPAVMVGGASPAVAGGIVVAAFSSGDLMAFRADDGGVMWTTPLVRPERSSAVGTITDIDGEPVIDRGRVFAISHAGVMASIDLQTGERIWVKDISGIQTPWTAGQFLFVVTTKGDVLCISASDGRVKWNTKLSLYQHPKDKSGLIVWHGPVLAGNRLILFSNYGYAVVLSPYSGELLGEMKLPGAASLPPVVANKTLYVLTNNATLIALR